MKDGWVCSQVEWIWARFALKLSVQQVKCVHPAQSRSKKLALCVAVDKKYSFFGGSLSLCLGPDSAGIFWDLVYYYVQNRADRRAIA